STLVPSTTLFRSEEPLHHSGEQSLGSIAGVAQKLFEPCRGDQEVTGEGICSNLLGRTLCRVRPSILENDVCQLVDETASLPHGMRAARDPDEYLAARRVPHGEAVLIGADVENRDVVPGRLLDQGHQIAERLRTQPMLLPKRLRRSQRLLLG